MVNESLYSTDDFIGGSHFHCINCQACLRFGYMSVVTVVTTVYKLLERNGVKNFHDIMDELCEETGVDKLYLLSIINQEMSREPSG